MDFFECLDRNKITVVNKDPPIHEFEYGRITGIG